jgi:hypothetical protein
VYRWCPWAKPSQGFLLPFLTSVLQQPRPKLSLPLRLIFLDFALGSAKLILSNILERMFTFVEVLPHTTLLGVVEWETGFATQQWSLD